MEYKNTPTLLAGFVCKSNAARAVGISHTQLSHLIDQGVLFPPQHKYGKRTYYRPNEVEILIDLYRNAKPAMPRNYCHDQWRPQGLYNIITGAKYLEMPAITLRTWVEKKQVTGPQHLDKGGIYYWTAAELDAIKRKKRKYFEKRMK